MKKLIALLLAMAMMLSLVACSSSSSSSEEEEEAAVETEVESESSAPVTDLTQVSVSEDDEPVYGGSLTMMWREINNYFDPGMLTTYGYGSMWMETLWSLDLSSDNDYTGSYVTYDQLYGQIAESYEFDYETGTLTVTIRDDIYFHDKQPVYGRQLVAEDVKYSYERVLGINPDVELVSTENDWTVDLYMVESITTDGDFTVIFQFAEGYNTEIALNDFIITPLYITSHEWDECEQTWEYAYGTGAFIVSGYSENTLELVKNENYYDYDDRYPENKLPYLDSVTLIQIDDTTTRLAQFISGDIEWLSSTSNVLSTAEKATLVATLDESEYNVVSYASGRPYSILLRNDTEPFDDVNVRIALQKAIDLETIHSSYLGYSYDMSVPGLWNPALTDFVWNWTDEVAEEYAYDPEAAIALLAEAGYPDGFEFDCVVLAPTTDTELYVLVASYLAEIGVTMNIITVTDIMEGISINTDPTETRPMSSTWGGQEAIGAAVLIYSESGSNYGLRHNSEEFEQAILDYYAATTMAERFAAAQTMDELFVTGHWMISLGGMQQYDEYISSAIHGYQGTRIVSNNWLGNVIAHCWKDAE